MEMFLVLAALSLIGIVVSAVLFSTAVEYADEREQERTVMVKPALAAPQFFTKNEALPARPKVAAPVAPATAAEIDALLLQIARHVQLEQAAAESFLHAPTAQSLHSRTASTLVH